MCVLVSAVWFSQPSKYLTIHTYTHTPYAHTIITIPHIHSGHLIHHISGPSFCLTSDSGFTPTYPLDPPDPPDSSMRPPAPALQVVATRRQVGAASASGASNSAPALDGSSVTANPRPPAIMISEDSRDSRSSSSTNSPVPADNEESDFFLGANDSQSSLGVVPNLQDMQVSDQECLPTVAALPSEILISIFSRISETKQLLSCMLVCKKWARNIVEILWHRPSCTSWDKLKCICYTLGLENSYFAYPDFIKRLNLAALADQVNDGTIMPLAVCPRVERMTLTNCKNLTDSGLIPLVRNSHHLLALDISGDANITEATIVAIAENCRRLQGLNISNCKQISNESLIQLAESCKYIKRVCMLPLLHCSLSETSMLILSFLFSLQTA